MRNIPPSLRLLAACNPAPSLRQSGRRSARRQSRRRPPSFDFDEERPAQFAFRLAAPKPARFPPLSSDSGPATGQGAGRAHDRRRRTRPIARPRTAIPSTPMSSRSRYKTAGAVAAPAQPDRRLGRIHRRRARQLRHQALLWDRQANRKSRFADLFANGADALDRAAAQALLRRARRTSARRSAGPSRQGSDDMFNDCPKFDELAI